MALLKLLRPHQWIKNVFVFAGLVFGARMNDPASVKLALLGFACYCAASSAVYVMNDIKDREEDRLHPRKRLRPIAAGQVSAAQAAMLGLGLLVVALGGSWLLDRAFALVVATYLILQAAYILALKQTVILDVITIGLGFVLRAVGGAVLIHVSISPWLVLCTFTLCLFMGFSKRRCELAAMATSPVGADAKTHRKTLAHYTPDLLNHMTTLTAGIAIVSFMLYTMDDRIKAPFDKSLLVYTLPIVVYAVFRFALLVEQGVVDGPTDVVLKDRPFQAALLLWMVISAAIVYRGGAIREWMLELMGGAGASGG